MSYDLTKSRIWQWTGIILILCLFGGSYWYFRSEAAQTITTSTSNARPDFEAPLISDLNLTRGTGSPTFSRADGADRRATVTDFEGLIRPVKNGEARFEGARRVENLLTYSEDFGNAIWSKDGTTPATVTTNQVNAPDGTLTADLLDISPAGDSRISYTVSGTNVANATYVISVWLRSVSGSGTWPYGYRKTDGTSVFGTFALTATWQRFSVTIPAVNSSSFYTIFWIGARAGGGTLTQAYVWGAQEEDITGQANQNPSEYVSTNVKTVAPYHGAGVDGVKYFATQNGNTVASNVVTEATGTAIPDATLHGYLAEGARTNLALQSESCDNASWAKVRSSVSENAVVAPSGGTTADKIIEDTTATSNHYVSSSVGTTSSATVTGSIYLKAAERTNAIVKIVSSTSPFELAYSSVNLSAGTASYSVGNGASNASGSIVALPNGWFRVTINGTLGTKTNPLLAVGLENAPASETYTGDGTSGLYLWGAQLEQASFASTYIPTTTASVARSIDTLSYPASGNIATNAGTVYAEHIPTESAADYGAIFNVYANGTNDGLDMIRNITTGATRANVRSGGTLMADISTGTSTLRTLSRNAFSWTTNAINVYKDGAVGTPDTSATMPTALGTNMYLGERPSGPIPLYGTLRNVKIWKQVMSGTFVQNLTAGQSGVIKQTTNKTANNTGLVGYWSFEDGSGTKATDFSENNNTGTLTNGPTWVDGRLGKAVNFDGTDDLVVVTNESPYRFSSDFSLSTWVKVPTTLAGYEAVIGKYAVTPSGWDFGIGSNGKARMSLRGTSTLDVSSGAGPDLRDNQWHYVVTVNTPTSIETYVDGILQNTMTGTWIATTNTDSLYIGNRDSNGTTTFSGTIDEVRLYNRALTQEEITKLYQVTSTKINYNQNDKLTSGLVGLWSFNGPDVSGTTATDRSGSGNNGTLTNGPTVTPGKVGQALSFDGTNDYIDAGSGASVNITGAISISVWAKTSDTKQQYFVSNRNGSSGYGFGMQGSGNSYRLRFSYYGSTDRDSSINAYVSDNNWHHYVVTNDLTNIQFYVDGALFSTHAGFSGNSSSSTLKIGDLPSVGGTDFAGSLDEPRIYNRALTAGEISSLYNSGK